MSSEQPTSVIAEGGFDQLREIQAALASAGIAAEIARPPQAQCSSCGTKLWLAVASEVAPQAVQLMEDLWQSGLSEQARLSANTIVDLDSDRRTCPACLHEFEAGPLECPECRLFIGG